MPSKEGSWSSPLHSRLNHPRWVIPRGWCAVMVTHYGPSPSVYSVGVAPLRHQARVVRAVSDELKRTG
jgi:hypothetical protein